MKTQLIVSGAKVFNVKQFGSGSRFGIKVSSKNKDGSYTKGTFINCKCRDVLETGAIYTLEGFLSDNEYNGNNSLEFIVMNATEGSHQRGETPKTRVLKEVIKKIDDIELDNNDECPF